jgi:hypothetical protein
MMNNKCCNNNPGSFCQKIILAGLVGGITEILWISVYSYFSSANATNIARQISATVLPFTADSYFAPMFGVFIHLVLSLVLAISFTATILKPVGDQYGTIGIMLSSFMTLGIVWAINFLVVLPILNPSFILLMPVIVTLISKLLFGVTMGWMLVKKTAYN